MKSLHFKRHELKFYMDALDMELLGSKLQEVMQLDRYCEQGEAYIVRSLYFDSFDNECLYEKQSGIMERSKFRIRSYGDNNAEKVKFEIKRKSGALVRKDSVQITKSDAKEICDRNFSVMLKYESPILNEAYAKFCQKLYAPKVIVDYKRVAYTLPYSNIRITFDQSLKSQINQLNLFEDGKANMPVILEGKQILEVKYDDFFPGFLRKTLSEYNVERMAISKYTLARRFHKVDKWEDN